jgi:hypothetical protein
VCRCARASREATSREAIEKKFLWIDFNRDDFLTPQAKEAALAAEQTR